jgi:ABC-type sugar transport system substrate-binding protein
MLVLPTTHGEDLAILREVLQGPENGAGKEYIYREGIVRQGMPPAQQADVILEAMEKGVSAFLVVAADPDAVAPALGEARDRGLAVVVIGDEVPVEGDPFPLVTFPPAAEAAGRVVKALSDDPGRRSGSETRAIVLRDDAAEWHAPGLAESLRAAAVESGMPSAKVVPFEKRTASAREAIAEALGDDLSNGFVLFEDRVGAEAAALVANDAKAGRGGGLRIGGFVADRDPRLRDLLGGRAVVVDRRVPEVARRASRTALRMLKGEKVPDRDVVEPEISGADPDVPR